MVFWYVEQKFLHIDYGSSMIFPWVEKMSFHKSAFLPIWKNIYILYLAAVHTEAATDHE